MSKEIIKVDIYQDGMEDGYNFYDYDGNYLGYIPKDELKNHDMAGRERVPVIETKEGKVEIEDGCYIVITAKGKRYSCLKITYEDFYG